MATIWVVEQGSYSDYRVVGVFSNRDAARFIADAINLSEGSDEATVDEWPLDPAVNELRQGLHLYFVEMHRDGTVDRVVRQDVSSYDIENVTEGPRLWKRSTAPMYLGRGLDDLLWVTVYATDETHAMKIANEKRAQFIASGEWDYDPAKP